MGKLLTSVLRRGNVFRDKSTKCRVKKRPVIFCSHLFCFALHIGFNMCEAKLCRSSICHYCPTHCALNMQFITKSRPSFCVHFTKRRIPQKVAKHRFEALTY